MDPNFLEELWSFLCNSIMRNILRVLPQLKPAVTAVIQGRKKWSERRRLTHKRGKSAWLLWTGTTMNLMM